MNKAIIISDSFKGTLSTFDIISLFQKAYSEVFPDSTLLSFPVSDGGEGFIDAISTVLCGKRIQIESFDSNQNKISADYFIDSDNNAYIECASCISLPKTKIKNPCLTSSYGVGILLRDAIEKGIKKVFLSLGGTSTNDCGTGILSALGVHFYDEDNRLFIPVGSTLKAIKRIDTTDFKKLTDGITITLLSDVKNPLLGENGCSYVFAKQKGATDSDVIELEHQMKAYHEFLLSQGYQDCSNIEGAGAAGGIGCGLITFLSSNIESGIDAYLNMIHFEDYLKDVDMLFTGEGHIDSQTSKGKAIDGICKVAKRHNIPVIAIVGGADLDSEVMIQRGISSIFPINREPISITDIKKNADEYYYLTALNVLRLIKTVEQRR